MKDLFTITKSTGAQSNESTKKTYSTKDYTHTVYIFNEYSS